MNVSIPLSTDRTERSSEAASRDQDVPAALEALRRYIDPDLGLVNKVIIEKMQSPIALIPQLAGHIVAAGGKRLRPLLTLASGRFFGSHGGRHVPLAACVEFIHTATLLHDDVVDDSELRRGAATANAVWGNKASVLVGDFLFSRAFQLMVADGSLKILKILSDASATIAEGEVLQLVTANDTATTVDDYVAVVAAKTARLFAAACQIGPVGAGCSEADEARFEAYGLNLGMAFQLVDDVLDYSAKQAELGKAIGDDFRDGKITMPVLVAFAAGGADEQAFWIRALEAQDIRSGDFDYAMRLLARHKALDAAMDAAKAYGEAARAALGAYPDEEGKRVLTGLVDFCLNRAY